MIPKLITICASPVFTTLFYPFLDILFADSKP